jgi:predicted amidophosphoribosyltransferase
MAIRSCRECGKDVSDRARACPNCGADVESFGSKFNKSAGNVLSIFFVLGVLFLFFTIFIFKR